jgi:hypothetical protein
VRNEGIINAPAIVRDRSLPPEIKRMRLAFAKFFRASLRQVE